MTIHHDIHSASVKSRLTAKRDVEHGPYGRMVGRMIRAYGRRVAGADPEDLAVMLLLRDDLERAIEAAVIGQREGQGASWADVARGLGVTRQAAQMRYGK